jgi:hypothetical protein
LQVYQLHVTLQDVSPPIWRRLHVDAAINLTQLHLTIQVAMGWQDKHLYEFVADGVRWGEASAERPRIESDAGVPLSRIAHRAGDEFVYRYDFGDDWCHRIVVEEELAAEERLTLPLCSAGERACPPEDCGGADGYIDLLEVLSHPGKGRYLDALAWVGPDFDSEICELTGVNAALSELR